MKQIPYLAAAFAVAVAVAVAAGVASCGRPATGPADSAPRPVRIGHFPNVTHAHGLIAHARTRAGDGWFERRLGPSAKVEWYTYNAGPSAMEALLAGSIDATYVGPNPAINAHVKTKGDDVRVIAGAARGGAALVVQGDGRIAKPADFRGRKLATPQLGNTQDVAARAWLASHGFVVTLTGGDVTVLPTANPDQLALFRKGDLDAVWTVEPWVSRLETEAGGKVLATEDDSLTTVLVTSARFLAERPDDARKLLRAHEELTDWIVAHPDEAKAVVIAELRDETRQEMSPALLDRCWPRLRFTPRIARADFEVFLRDAQKVGFLQDVGEPAKALARLVEPPK
jgi:NitT/TauT family transport system substrate-binding protein